MITYLGLLQLVKEGKQPIVGELIRCKDCKYFSTDFNGYNHCDLYLDALSPWAESRYSPSESDYCSQAERKEADAKR